MNKQRTAMGILAVIVGLAGCDGGRDVVVADLHHDADTDPGDGDGGASAGDGDGASNTCAWANATTERVPTTVWFVIAHSGRMLYESPPSVSPWNRLEHTLLGPGGLIPKYEASFRFGAVFHGADTGAASCPNLNAVTPAINNATKIVSLALTLANDPQTSLSGYALNHIASAPRPADGKVVVVMTRGEENGWDGACFKDTPAGATSYGLTMAYEAAHKLAAANIPVFVVEFGTQSRVTEPSKMLAEIGNAGYAPFFIPPQDGPSDKDELDEVFQTILAESVSCEFQLNGKVASGHECDGEVSIDGKLHTCDDPNGWRLKEGRTVEFVGQACKDLRAAESAQVKARFPCDVFEIL